MQPVLLVHALAAGQMSSQAHSTMLSQAARKLRLKGAEWMWLWLIVQEAGAAVSSLLAGGRVVKEQACFLPLSPDGVPVIGRVPGARGAYIAAGGLHHNNQQIRQCAPAIDCL